ncbi:MAG: glycosyl hydrolase 115 family protein [Acutalibacteraceae bacterium]|jgi:hypothetical protein
MYTLLDKQKSTKIFVDSAESPVVLAAKDLLRNLRELSNFSENVELCDNADIASIKIAVRESGSFNDVSAPNETEGYTVSITSDGVTIVGHDSLGAVYGIYSFCEKILKISPVYRMTEIFPERVDRLDIEEQTYSQGAPAVAFRGWFLNDEDLLTDFKESSGKRTFVYRFYSNVMNLDVLDAVLETALRCGMNMIIPSSFVDIMNPPEEGIVKATYARGLYITQHHVEPMGVSFFAAEKYFKENMPQTEISFVKEPEAMCRVWRAYAEKWAKYADRVIWQLGLRGRGDRPVWDDDDNIPKDDEHRGAIIANAIQAEYDIIKDVLGTDDFISTVTLYNETCRFYEKNCLPVPKGVIVIFSDTGANHLLSRDFYTVERESDRKYGIYYHIAYYRIGPHLAEACPPEKMLYSLNEAKEKDSLYYCITNVSNVRPFAFSVLWNGEILKGQTDPDRFSQDYYRSIFGKAGDEVFKGMKQYFNCFADLGQEAFDLEYEKNCWPIPKRGELPFVNYAADDGTLVYGKWNCYDLSVLMPKLKESEKRFSELLLYFKALEAKIPKSAKNYFEIYQLNQTSYMLNLTKWRIAYNNMLLAGTAEEVERYMTEAVDYLKTIQEDNKVLERGYFEGWLAGEKKLNFTQQIINTKEAAENRIKELSK